MPILQMGSLRLREIKHLDQSTRLCSNHSAQMTSKLTAKQGNFRLYPLLYQEHNCECRGPEINVLPHKVARGTS